MEAGVRIAIRGRPIPRISRVRLAKRLKGEAKRHEGQARRTRL